MKKEENPIQDLLNKIYNEPDLGEEVLNFLQPHVLSAYTLLEEDKYKKQKGIQQNFSNEEDFHALESILYKDLTGIVKVYTKLPLEYRNTHKVKAEKTHRVILLESMNSLVNKMRVIEKLQYEEIDKEAIVKNKTINTKYSQYESNELKKLNGLETELDNNINFNNEFDLQNFKKNNPTELNLNSIDYKNIEEKNLKIELKRGIIEYKVKNKMKTFMRGVYHATKEFLINKKVGKKYKDNAKIAGLIITAPVTIPFIIWSENGFGGFLFICAIYSGIYYGGSAILNIPNGSALRDISYIQKYGNAPTEDIKKLNMLVLEEYAKSNRNLKLIQSKTNSDEKLMIDIKANKKVCIKTIDSFTDKINKNKVIGLSNYNINNVNLNIEKEVDSEIQKAICKLPENNIHIELNLIEKIVPKQLETSKSVKP